MISRVGVGWDNVDRASAAEFGILSFKTEGVLTQSVAELTLGLILAALRRIPAHDHAVRQNQWKKQMGMLLTGKTVGLVGFGDIGQRRSSLVREARIQTEERAVLNLLSGLKECGVL